ncbi:tyrosine-protein phosphatase [Pediococcus damnosus]|uniref:tyrosine-protein phosphatase n=1 Tax=Pediococcus damnosus TaxID=51663 RepID=UPI0007143906|nr:tyrosine-protein phosphatase [Pediococcus damnosus]KRN50475.1 ptp protein [Pediococcus damnosus]
MVVKKERILNVEGSVNFRELGGYSTKDGKSIKWQKLLRSGDLSRLTDEAVQNLNDYGLHYDIDLRSPSEAGWLQDRLPNDVIYRSYPVYPIAKSETSDLPELPNDSTTSDYSHPYALMIMNPQSQLAFRMMFQDMLANSDSKKSLLFHCAAGKDRTGVAGFLILTALGVDYPLIKQDYILTNVVYSTMDQDSLRKQLKNDKAENFVNKMNSVFQVQGDTLDIARQAILDNYGDYETYFKQAMKLSKADLDDLKAIYLE